MYFPLVYERVWVSGCPHEFIVVTTNYSACLATISLVEDRRQVRRCPFHQLFPHDEFEASQVRSSVTDEMVDITESSRSLIRGAKADSREMRKIVSSTGSIIRKSQEMIAQTDRLIARWKTLGCKP